MIATEELQATINRLELLANNIDDKEEQVLSNILQVNLKQILQQIEVFIKTEEFKQMVKEKTDAEISES